jgi:C1A family cysteine protease
MIFCQFATFGSTVFWAYNHPGQMTTEQDYPYLNWEPTLTCPANVRIFQNGVKIEAAFQDLYCNEERLKQLVVQYGAVETGMFSDDVNFKYGYTFTMGIYQSCSSNIHDHSVVVVGYGVENGIPYCKVKNSWGTNWGDQGFFKIVRGQSACGIGTVCIVANCIKEN